MSKKVLYVICIDLRGRADEPIIWFKGNALEVDEFMQQKQEDLESCGLETTQDEGWFKTYEYEGEEVFSVAIVAGFARNIIEKSESED